MTRNPAPFCPYPRDYERPTCYSCFRPKAHCICNLIPQFEAHCNILILQHPNEWRKYYSTTKLLSHSIINSKTLRSIKISQQRLAEMTAGQKVYLLFPAPDAADCEKTILDRNCTVVAIDGTWSEAKKILFRNPHLKLLPTLSFSKPLRSNYRIRRQPKPECLSTLESIAHLLTLNAQAQGLESQVPHYTRLFEGFDKMIDQQLQYWPEKSRTKVT